MKISVYKECRPITLICFWQKISCLNNQMRSRGSIPVDANVNLAFYSDLALSFEDSYFAGMPLNKGNKQF